MRIAILIEVLTFRLCSVLVFSLGTCLGIIRVTRLRLVDHFILWKKKGSESFEFCLEAISLKPIIGLSMLEVVEFFQFVFLICHRNIIGKTSLKQKMFYIHIFVLLWLFVKGKETFPKSFWLKIINGRRTSFSNFKSEELPIYIDIKLFISWFHCVSCLTRFSIPVPNQLI